METGCIEKGIGPASDVLPIENINHQVVVEDVLVWQSDRLWSPAADTFAGCAGGSDSWGGVDKVHMQGSENLSDFRVGFERFFTPLNSKMMQDLPQSGCLDCSEVGVIQGIAIHQGQNLDLEVQVVQVEMVVGTLEEHWPQLKSALMPVLSSLLEMDLIAVGLGL